MLPAKKYAACLALVLAIGFLARANSLPGNFIYDDRLIVLDNQAVQNCDVKKILSTPYWPETKGFGLFRPLATLSYCANAAIVGPSPLLYHLTNLLLHLFNSALIFLIIIVIAPKRLVLALAAALLFSLHPRLVEPINSIVGRAELLVSCFTLLSMLCVVSWRQAKLPKPLAAIALPLCFFLGLLSKENAILLPIQLVLLWASYETLEQKSWSWQYFLRALINGIREQWRVAAAMAVVLALVVWWRSQVLTHQTPVAINMGLEGIWQHTLVALQILGKALYDFVLPIKLQWDYAPFAMPAAESLWQPLPLFALATFAAAVGLAALRLTHAPLLVLIWFVVAIATTLQIVPIGVIYAERLMYLPYALLIVVVATLIPEARSRRTVYAAATIFCAIATLYAVRVWIANPLWQDPFRFWSYTQKIAPHSLSANLNLGIVFRNRGDLESAERYLLKNIALAPETSTAYEKLAEVFLQQGKFEKARQAIDRMLNLEAKNAKHYSLRAIASAQLKDFKDAESNFKRAMELQPDNPQFENNLATLYIHTKKFAAATELANKTLQRLPTHPPSQLIKLTALKESKKTQELKAQLQQINQNSAQLSPKDRHQLACGIVKLFNCKNLQDRCNPPPELRIVEFVQSSCDSLPH